MAIVENFGGVGYSNRDITIAVLDVLDGYIIVVRAMVSNCS